MQQGSNYYTTCETCGALGHIADTCPLKALYHSQVVRALAKGSQDPEVYREVYRIKLKNTAKAVDRC